ncbi:MAG: MarC family protein [Chloroflexi bacterium]|nr:MarC family protein [Chloroflexota bacterium]
MFVPLFVTMDPLGILPFWVPFVGAIQPRRRRRVVYTALATGLVLGLAFLGLGRGIFLLLGITVSDFLVAGGVVLLAISLRDLLSSGSEAPPAPTELMAVVPIGTPLLVGPAAISMLILLTGLFSLWLVVLAFLANLLLAWLVFANSERIIGLFGKGGLQAVSKVSYLLLAAIAIQLIRRGLADFFPS